MHPRHPRTAPLARTACALGLAALALSGCKSNAQSADEASTEAPAPVEETAAADEASAPEPGAEAKLGAAAAEALGEDAAPAPAAEPPKLGPDGRPLTFAEGTPRQQELLTGAMEKLDAGDTDAAAMFTLVLTGDDQPASMEKLIGLLVLAEIYRVEEKPARAIERLEAARDEFPPSVELPATLAELYAATGDSAKMIDNLRQAVAIDTDRLDLLAALADGLVRSGDTAGVEATVADYDKALERIRSELGATATTSERRVELMQALAGVRDARATQLLVDQMRHANVEIVGQAFELVVNHGHVDAIPMMEALRAEESRPEVKDALGQAIEYMHELEKSGAVQELPVMPPAAVP